MTSSLKESLPACSPVHPSSPANQISRHEYNLAERKELSTINVKPSVLASHKLQTPTLRTNPGVSIIVWLGQCAYSAPITIGLGETAVLVFFKSASVRDFIISAMVDAKTTGLPYSSESSSYVSIPILKFQVLEQQSSILAHTQPYQSINKNKLKKMVNLKTVLSKPDHEPNT